MVVNSLYYGSPAYRDSITAPKAVTSGFSISDDIIAAALRNIYSRDYAGNDIEPEMFRAISRSLNEAADIGIGQAGFDTDEAFTNALRHSNEVFAAFKVHRAQNDMAARLLDSNGRLKPFEQWRDEVLPIASHQCGSWLRTEYDTAVLRAHQAADWQQFQAEKDVLPNLKWMPSTSANPGADHMPFWGTILPIDHPFWDQHRPGDRWNCKCALTSTDELPTPVPNAQQLPSHQGEGPGVGSVTPQPGLKDNPGKSHAVFSDDHPYFPKDCKHCAFYNPTIKARLATVFTARVKDCYHCPYIDGCIGNIREDIQSGVKPPHIEDYSKLPGKEVYTSPYHGKNELAENKRLAEFLFDKLNEPIYLLPRLDSTNVEQAALRETLLPRGVFQGKNPDYMIWGMLFDAKSMVSNEYNGKRDNSKRKIENRFKSAKEQAGNFLIEINDSFPRDLIHETVVNYLNMTKAKRIIMIKWRGKLFVYTNKKR